MSGGPDGSHPRVLARQFAAALAELRDTWELQYWRGGPLPRTAPAGDDAERSTLNAERSTLNAERSTLNAERSTLNAERSTLNAERSTLNAQRSTPDASPSAHLPVVHDEATPASSGLREQAQQWSPATKLEYLRRRNLGDCQRCGLARTRTNIVFGVGNPEAELMFVGEAPGADEDRVGEPFVGRAGQRLDAWLTIVGLRRDEVYIANVLKCRPPGNRDPRPEEVDRCSPFLQAQIRAITPKVIVALGRHAGMLLTRREDLTMKAMRGARLFYDPGAGARPIPIVATYHPAYVLRQEGSENRGDGPNAEQLVLQDLRRALELCRAST